MANEFKIKNGLLVSGSITGITEPSSDNSAKMASTAWVRELLASSGGAAIRTTQTFTATANQTTFTVSGGYTVGLIDVYINGAFLNTSSYTASNGTTVVLTDAAALSDIIDVVIYKPFEGLIGSSDQIPEGVTNLYYTTARVAAYLNANNYATQSYVTTATSTLVPQTRTITVNGDTQALSGNVSFTVAGGVTSFNTRTGAITLSSADVTTALGFTPISSYTETDTLATVTGRGATTSTALTLNNTLNVSVATSQTVPVLNLTGTGTGQFQRGVRLLNNNLTAGDSIMYAIGKSDTDKNMAYMNFVWAGAASTANRLVIGMFNVDNILNFYASGNVVFGGTTDVANVKLNVIGNTQATSFIKSGGTASQFLKADGSVDSSSYITSASVLTTAITGYAVGGNTALAATDTILGAFNKIQGQINARLTSYTETSTLANVTARGATTNGSITVNGYITVRGANSSSSIYMSDDDEGQRELHCNSNRIGFLTQGGGWGSWCNDDGSWTSVSDITAYSDARIKENVKTVDNALDKVLQLRGVYFNRIGTTDTSLGVIAQETQLVIPEVVKEQNDGMLSVAYGNMAGLFIEAFKEQQAQILQQNAQITELMEIVKTLKGL